MIIESRTNIPRLRATPPPRTAARLSGDASILSVAQATACLQLARAALCGRDVDETEDVPAVAFEKVNLTIRSDGRLRASASGRGATLAQAIVRVAIRALADARFGVPIDAHEIARGRVELWIQYGSELIAEPEALDLGVDGVELRQGGRRASFKPSVALTSAVASPTQLLDRLAEKAGLPPEAWRSAGAEILRTRWEHYAEGPGERPSALRLRRLRPAEVAPIAQSEALEAAMLAAQRLIVTQQAAGYYTYRDHPFQPAPSSGAGNLVRQAGCAFAVARAAEALADRVDTAACGISARRAVAFLLPMAVDRPGGALFLVEPGAEQGKLGLNALALATLQCHALTDRYPRERGALLAGVLAMQRDDGSFRCLERNDSSRTDGQKQDYYPGEALMALCRELRDGSQAPRRSIEKAFPWHRAYFRANPSTAFVPWQADAWRMFAEWISEDERRGGEAHDYSAFVFEIVDWLLGFQRVEAGERADFLGGFSAPGGEPGASTASYVEAVVSAYSLASRFGLAERRERYRRAARLAIGFLFRLRIPREVAFLFSNPIAVVGGTPRNLSDMTLRCDFDQHMLTALLAALEAPGLLGE